MKSPVIIAFTSIVTAAIIELMTIGSASANISTAAAFAIEFQPSGSSASISIAPGGGIAINEAAGIRSISGAVASGNNAVASAQTTASGTSAVAQGLTNTRFTLGTQTISTGITLAEPNSSINLMLNDMGGTLP